MVQLHIRIDDELDKALTKFSSIERKSKNEFVNEVLHKFCFESNDSKVIKEIDKLQDKLDLIDKKMMNMQKDNTERLVKISIKNMKFILLNYHLLRIATVEKFMQRTSKKKKLIDDRYLTQEEANKKLFELTDIAEKHMLNDLKKDS